MKKTLIIILVVLIILLGGAWAYLLLNGAPEGLSDIKDDLLSGGDYPSGTTDPNAALPLTTEPVEAVAVNPAAVLQKVSARPVAGAVLVQSSSSPLIRYVEKGTGALYEIDLTSGSERQLPTQGLPGTVHAIFAPSGTRVVLETEVGGTRSGYTLGTLLVGDSGSSVLETEQLPLSRSNLAFTETGDALLYTDTNTRGELSGYAYDLKAKTVRTLFSVPFLDAAVLWDKWGGDQHFVYTKAAQGYTGFLYTIGATALEKMDTGTNLTALRTAARAYIVNKNAGEGPYSFLVAEGIGVGLPIETLPQKCGGAETRIWCGASIAMDAEDFPLSWYMGRTEYADKIYVIDRTTGDTTLAIDPEEVAREQIDVVDLNVAGNRVLFRNKRDDSLWLYNTQGR